MSEQFVQRTIKAHLTTTRPMLGMTPGDPDIYSKYIASKAPDAASKAEEIEAKGLEQVMREGTTVFPLDEDGNRFIWDYQLKGFMKDACGMLRTIKGTKSSEIKAYKKKIDGQIFLGDRQSIIHTDKPVRINERRLRASTPQGERISVVASEEVAEGATIDIEVWVLNEEDTDLVLEWLDYGALHGLCGWRNAGYGSFRYEYEVEENGKVVASGSTNNHSR